MKNYICHLGCGLLVLSLAAGCQSSSGTTTGAKPEPQMAQIQGSARKVLADVLAKAGLTATDLVLEADITFPPPSGGDKNAKPAWKGCFTGSEKAVLHADDQVLIIAKTMPCNATESRYEFNPANRTWTLAANNANPEGNLLWVLFNGTARNLVKEVAEFQDSRQLLGAMVRPARTITGAMFPAQVSVEEMHNNVVELGLSALDEHLRTVHADGHPCNPDVHVYIRSAADK